MAGLTPKQLRAAELRAQGRTHTEIAAAVGVNRVTVTRWFGRADVRAELGVRVQDIQVQEARAHAALRDRALGVVAAAIDGGDSKAALAFLRLQPSAGPWPQLPSSDHPPTGDGETSIGAAAVAAINLIAGLNPVPTTDDEIVDVFFEVIRGLEMLVICLRLGEGEGLLGFRPAGGDEQSVLRQVASLLSDATDDVLGDASDDDDDEPPFDKAAMGRAIDTTAVALTAVAALLEDVEPRLVTLALPADGVVADLRDMRQRLQRIRARPVRSTSRKNIVASINDLYGATMDLAMAMHVVEFVEADILDDAVSDTREAAPENPVAGGSDR